MSSCDPAAAAGLNSRRWYLSMQHQAMLGPSPGSKETGINQPREGMNTEELEAYDAGSEQPMPAGDTDDGDVAMEDDSDQEFEQIFPPFERKWVCWLQDLVATGKLPEEFRAGTWTSSNETVTSQVWKIHEEALGEAHTRMGMHVFVNRPSKIGTDNPYGFGEACLRNITKNIKKTGSVTLTVQTSQARVCNGRMCCFLFAIVLSESGVHMVSVEHSDFTDEYEKHMFEICVFHSLSEARGFVLTLKELSFLWDVTKFGARRGKENRLTQEEMLQRLTDAWQAGR